MELGDEPPLPKVSMDGQSIEVLQSSYCWKSGCTDYESPVNRLQESDFIPAQSNSEVTFSFDGKQPAEVTVTWSHNGNIQQEVLSDYSFQTPDAPGVYYYSLSANWLTDVEKRVTEGSSSYVFAVKVG